jgi:pimeloyl-ACP methyl ester carboxylesterase
VLPAIAETNRVCAYDRPGTFLVTGDGIDDFEKSRNTPVHQPRTLRDGVSDLHALLRASGERGPYVVVGHSLGGAIAKLYASEYPRDVSGLVLIDHLPYQARNALTREWWRYWKNPLLGAPSEEALDLYPHIEQNANQRNFQQDRRSKPLKPMPLMVFSADEP